MADPATGRGRSMRDDGCRSWAWLERSRDDRDLDIASEPDRMSPLFNGYGDAEIAKVTGGSTLRVLEQVWGR